MKRKLGLLSLVILVGFLCSMVTAAELDSKQLAFRSEVMSFLREEGFSPRIDTSDESVEFKKEGQTYWIYVGEGSPYYITVQRAGISVSDEEKASAILAANECNATKKAAKVYVASNNSVCFVVESFTRSVEDFKYVYYRTMRVLDAAFEQFQEEFNAWEGSGSTSAASLSISNVELANVDVDGNIITEFGKTLYDFNSRYTKPKLTINASRAGTYTIYVRHITPTGMSTGTGSPDGYSYSDDVKLDEGLNVVQLSGWGSNNPPKWSMGDYRMEFYYNGNLLYTKRYTIY